MAELSDAQRAVYRSRHLFLMLIALVNLALGQTWRNGWMQRALSLAVLTAPLPLALAFWFEPPSGISGGGCS